MILYTDDIVLLNNDNDELMDILSIFSRFELTIYTSKTQTMTFNVSEEIKAKESLVSLGDVQLKNIRTFKYLGHTIANNEKDPSYFLSLRIASAFQIC